MNVVKFAINTIIIFLIITLIVVVGFSQQEGCYAGSKTKAKVIQLNHKVITIKKGKTLKLKAKVKTKKKVVWKSSNEKVVIVNKKGSVIAKNKGKAKITARIKGTKKESSCTIYVGTPAKKINISKKTVKLRPKKQLALKVKISPKNATVKKVYYSSANKKVATVNSKGKITAKKEGSTLITVRAKDEACKSRKIKVNVKKSAEDYSYEVIPLTSPFNELFYIKTNNPNPDSFVFVDNSTAYANRGEIVPTEARYSDVVYKNKKTGKVHGGYIAEGSDVDGGQIQLRGRKVTGFYNLFNLSTGETTVEKEYSQYKTNVTKKIAKLYDTTDYLINKYGDNKLSYFDNLDEIQLGFSSECLYSGSYVLGKQKKSKSEPYYSLSTSPHVDQTFYIQSPYYREDNSALLVTQLYPLRYDSIGFPSVMASVAAKLNSKASIKWSSSAHYLINVTLNGTTRSYGGAGNGKGQGIYANQVKYKFLFNKASNDSYPKIGLSSVRKWLEEYSKMEVAEEPKDEPELTWAGIRNRVGKDGAYVKLTIITSIFGGTTDGYTFLYDDESDYEGTNGWGAVGHFSNAWYDGRYYNEHEYFYPGAKFEETVTAVQPSIILKDPVIKLPNDAEYLYDYAKIDDSIYDKDSGKWKGFIHYFYNEESEIWECELLDSVTYQNGDEIDNQAFIDECTITMDEALGMNLDANTNKNPGNYYIYDGSKAPGTYHEGE